MHCLNEKIKLFLEWATFNELCFDSMVIKKDVWCEKKAKSFSLKEKMRHHLYPFFYKQSIFDPRPENCLSFSKKPPQKIV